MKKLTSKNKPIKGKYVDGFLISAPKNKVPEYRKMAKLGAKIWMKHGALDYKECLGDDLKPKNMGEGMTPRSFLEAAGTSNNEVVWFSYILFKSKKHRDSVNAKVMKDSAMDPENWGGGEIPFDMKKFCYGGFTVEVSG
jgi:uncharacterized protein YbaA (DUF1428 family)